MKTPQNLTSIIGMLCIVGGVFVYGSYGVFIRYVSSGFGAFSQNYVRSVLILFFLILYLFIRRPEMPKFRKVDTKWGIIWSMSGAFTMVFLYFAFINIPLGTAYFLFYSTMIITGILLGQILFKEKMDIQKIIALFLIFAGFFLIFNIQITISKIIYIGAALVGGLFIGTWNSTSKKLSNYYSMEQMLVFGTLITALVGFAGAVISKETLPPFSMLSSWYWMIGFALAELLATILVILGFKYLEVQKASLIMPLEIIFAALFGFIAFQETLPLMTIIGGSLIFIGAMVPSLKLQLTKV